MNRPANRAALAAALFVAGAVPALAVASPWLGELDSVNFALALERYDLAASSPHFPGYPVYVALARLGAAAGLRPAFALALPGALLLGAGLAALGLALSRRPGWTSPGLGAAALAASSPLWVLAGARPLSDAAGTGLALLALAAALGGRAALGGAAAGLALGVRASLWPLALAHLLWPTAAQEAAEEAAGDAPARPADASSARCARLHAAIGLAAGLAAWGVPLGAVVGPLDLVQEGVRFVAGHFGEWGGTVVTQPDPIARLLGLARAFHVGFLGGAGPALAAPLAAVWLVGIAGVAIVPAARRRAPVTYALRWAALYAAWVLLGQNLAHPRHLLPLVAPLAIACAAGWQGIARPTWAGIASLARGAAAATAVAGAVVLAVAVAVAVAVVAPLAVRHAKEEPPALRAARYVAARFAPAEVLYYGGAETRVMSWYLPALRARRLAAWTDVAADVAALGCPAATVVMARSPAAPAPAAPAVVRFDDDPALGAGDRSVVLHAAPACVGPLASAGEVRP